MPATRPEKVPDRSPKDALSARELELLKYLAEGSTNKEIARAMVGREVSLSAGKRVQPIARPTGPQPDQGLEVRNLNVASSRGIRVVDGVSFSIKPGEILGIAGVEGNGQTELVEARRGFETRFQRRHPYRWH